MTAREADKDWACREELAEGQSGSNPVRDT